VNNATTRTNPAATDDAQTKFNENDQVTVSNNGNQADYAYNGTSWAPAIADKYLLWDRSNLAFNCWYPAGGNNTATIGYLTADQSSADLMAKSDYMNAEKVLQSADEALNFNLERKTARLILKISAFTEQFESTPTIKQVRIVSKASTVAGETNTIDITPLTPKGEGEIGGIGTTYTALVAPGKVVAKLYFTDNTSTEEPVTMTTNVTTAGNSYIYNLIVGKKKIEVTGITAGPWIASGTTTGDIICYPYVTFKAEQPQTFKMTATKYYKISGLQYSVNFGDWKDVVADEVVEFGGDKGDLRLRGKNNLNGTAASGTNYSKISFDDADVNVACTGDIRTLLDYENYENVATWSARFCSLFNGCTQLTAAPELPAEKLAVYCYTNMFRGCTSLEKAPDLPAMTLAPNCYQWMFYGCIKLKEAPKLEATSLERGCYNGMFFECTSLTTAPDLPATKLAISCYTSMFNKCSKLETGPKELPATELKENCYNNMFGSCTSLNTVPKLPVSKLEKGCYSGMFFGCNNLSSVTMLATSDQITKDNLMNWLGSAGKDVTTGRTLILNNQDAYDALKANRLISTNWQTGKCTVKAADGSDIK
jgi:uncharacterized lipoprotein YehR (DUF1307 family)